MISISQFGRACCSCLICASVTGVLLSQNSSRFVNFAKRNLIAANLAFRAPNGQNWRQGAARHVASAVGESRGSNGRENMETKRDVERFIDDIKMRRLDRATSAGDWPRSAW